MDHVRARTGALSLSLSLAALLLASGCADQPEAPPADDLPATPAPAEGMAPEAPEGSGPEAGAAPAPVEGS